MDPVIADVPTLTLILTHLGLGHNAAAAASLIVGSAVLVAHILPWFPVPEPTAPAWWRFVYGVLTKATGNYKNLAPVPPSEKIESLLLPVPELAK